MFLTIILKLLPKPMWLILFEVTYIWTCVRGLAGRGVRTFMREYLLSISYWKAFAVVALVEGARRADSESIAMGFVVVRVYFSYICRPITVVKDLILILSQYIILLPRSSHSPWIQISCLDWITRILNKIKVNEGSIDYFLSLSLFLHPILTLLPLLQLFT